MLDVSSLTLSGVTTIAGWTAGVSLLLVWIGARGRRVDTHPICRRCEFDLFGLPGTSARCPECGADLARRRATRIGHRRRIRLLLTLAIPLLLISGGALGVAGYAKARGVNVYRYKPVSWLIREMRHADLRPAALDELLARLADGWLSDADV